MKTTSAKKPPVDQRARKVNQPAPARRVKCPDFEKELKAIYGDRTFDHLLARYDEAVS